MSEAVSLVAEIRENIGTGAAREIRRNGKIPAVIYGAEKPPMNILVEEKEITKLHRKKHFISTVINLKIDNNNYLVLPKVIDLHPITDIVRHLDFVFLENKTQKMEVPIVYEGREKSAGIKKGGFLNIIKRTLTIVAPSNNIPRNITIDVSNVYIGHTIKASSIKLPEGCELFNKKEFVVASITGRGGKSQSEDEAETEQATTVAAPVKAVAASKVVSATKTPAKTPAKSK